MSDFIGSNLRLIRHFHNMTITELSEKVEVSKQRISYIENGTGVVSAQLLKKLSTIMNVNQKFFFTPDLMPIGEEQCHFRSQYTTKIALRQFAKSKGDMLKRFVNTIDQKVYLPKFDMSKIEVNNINNIESIELVAEKFRSFFGLGFGPLSNITRIVENAGVVVFKIDLNDNLTQTKKVDALSFATQRPIIVLNKFGVSACRERFGIAHELGHLLLHIGVLTGDRITETQANRFASAVLLPRSTLANEFSKALRGNRIHWEGLSELKYRWKISKSALIYRARQLGFISEEQAMTGYIKLKRNGEALQENEDVNINSENPELIVESLKMLNSELGITLDDIANEMHIGQKLLSDFLDLPTTSLKLNTKKTTKTSNVANDN
ncbi:MAG: XRE family transcriptional regulator [Candidatus Pacebacteria bacterium]|nr:XRE family transcriptional regulator [Candidatus Paceibacterota bacterium]